MRFSRQEYRGGLPFPSPGDRPNPGIEPGSSALQADSLASKPPGKPMIKQQYWKKQNHTLGNAVGPPYSTLPWRPLCVLVTQSCLLFVIPWAVVCPAPLVMGFFMQEY